MAEGTSRKPDVFVIMRDGWQARCGICAWFGEFYPNHKPAADEAKAHGRAAHGKTRPAHKAAQGEVSPDA